MDFPILIPMHNKVSKLFFKRNVIFLFKKLLRFKLDFFLLFVQYYIQNISFILRHAFINFFIWNFVVLGLHLNPLLAI